MQERKSTKEHKNTFEYDIYAHYLDGTDGILGVYVKTYQVVLFKYAHFILCHLQNFNIIF